MSTVVSRLERTGERHAVALPVAATLAAVVGVLVSFPLAFGIAMSNGSGDDLSTSLDYPWLLALAAIVVSGFVALLTAQWVETRRQRLAIDLYWIALATFLVILPVFVAVLWAT